MRDTDIEVVIVYQTTLVTHNTGEFGRIEGLHVEDWEIEA
jgi:predicted nucleic acid-binding protein